MTKDSKPKQNDKPKGQKPEKPERSVPVDEKVDLNDTARTLKI